MSDEEHLRTNVLLEEIRSNVVTLVEGHGVLTAGLAETNNRLDRRFDEVNGRLDRIEHRVTKIDHRVTKIEHHLDLNGAPVRKRRKSK